MAISRDTLNLIRNISINKVNSLEENAKIMKLSERSIRYKIEDCNYYLKLLKLPVLKIKLGMIYFNNNITEVIEKIKNNINIYNFSQDEREKIIINYFIFRKNRSGEELLSFLNVSEATFKNDIRRVRKYLKTFMLNLDTKKYLILGEEENIRKIILNIFLKNYNIFFRDEKIKISRTYYHGYFIFWEEMDKYFNENYIYKAYKILKKILKENNANISDEAFKVLFFYILLVLNRNKDYKIDNIKNINFFSNTEEYKKTKDAFQELKLSKYEILSLTEYFLGSHIFDFENNFYFNWVQIETFVMNLIKEVEKQGNYKLHGDEVLIEGLINHMKPAMYRSKRGIGSNLEIYDEFKENYPLILSQVKNAWNNIGSIDFEMTNEEIACIAMYFQLSIKRINKKKCKDILIVCGLGYSTSKFLAENIKEIFSVNIIDLISYNALENYKKLDKVDLIITTIKNLENNFIPTVTVSPILKKEDIEKLTQLHLSKNNHKIKLSSLLNVIKNNTTNLNEMNLIKEIKNKFKNEIIDDMKKIKDMALIDMISRTRISRVKKVESWEEGIYLGGENLVKEGYALKGYIDEIISRIKEFGSYMVIQEGIILAHGAGDGLVNKTGLEILFLEKSVEFPENENINLIITLASKDKKEHINGLMEFINLIREKKIIDILKEKKNSEEMYETLKYLI